MAAAPAAWRAAGFDVEGAACRVGRVHIRLAGGDAGRGIVSWSLRGLDGVELDGLPTGRSDRALPDPASPHANAVVSVDHVVAFTPDLERTTQVLREAGLDLRRVREGPTPGGATRQGFFRLGEVLLEVIEAPEGSRLRSDPDAPARFYGISFLVDDLDACAGRLGALLGDPRDAVQPGRRIATARREAALGMPVSFITPGPGGGDVTPNLRGETKEAR